MRLLLSTGSSEIDKSIKKQLNCVQYIDAVYSMDELYDCIENLNPDAILFTEIFNVANANDVLINLKSILPNVHIIYVSLNYTPSNLELLNRLGITEVFYGSFTISELEYIMKNKRE